MKQISIEIIHKCPNKCIHCSSCSSPLCKDIIPGNVIYEIIDGAKKIGTELLSISGGEPFLHEDLVPIVERAKEKGIKVYIYTSGIYLDEYDQVNSLPQNVLSELKKVGVDRIIFDLPAISEKVYDRFMGTKGRLKYVFKSIDLTKSLGICSEIHFVPTKINIDEIEGVLSFAKDRRIDRVSFLGLVPHGRAKENALQLYLSTKETTELKEKLSVMQSDFIRIGIPLQIGDVEYQCYAGIGKLCIRYDGKVFGCEAFKYVDLYDDSHNTIEPDSVYERPIDQIFRDSAYLKAELEFIKKNMSIAGCNDKCPVQRMFRSVG